MGKLKFPHFNLYNPYRFVSIIPSPDPGFATATAKSG
jgi:hypothetical protein